jgi:ATPase subunit of ABC transporter with duplicated ATPase domains
VKTIARVLGCISGTVSEGKGLNIGYFAQQELDVLRPHETPLQHLLRLAKESPAPDRATASRICAASSAPSISPATWSSRRSAR